MPIVLGGGLSGLAAAYYLMKRHITPVTVYESSKHLGGWIRSEHFEKENFIFESGPRTIRPKGPSASTTLELIEDIGLDNNLYPIFSTHPAARKRMIYAHNELHLLPSSLGSIFFKRSPFSKPLIAGIFNDLKAPKLQKKIEDESIYNFVERRFGTEIAQYAVSPLICGICAGDAKEISVRFLMNDIFEKEQTYGSVFKGMIMGKLFEQKKSVNKYTENADSCNLTKKVKKEKWSMYSLKGGLQTLPVTLAKILTENGVNIQTEAECFQIHFEKHKAILNTNRGEKDTDYIISALPSYKLASLIAQQHPLLANQLKAIPYVDVAVINLRFNTSNLLKEEAFGFLVPPIEKLPILGIIFDSCCFHMKGSTVLTVMMGGRWFQEYFGKNPTEEYLLDTALKYVKEILKIDEKPSNLKVNILRQCIPQYIVGHRARILSIRNYIEKNRLPLSVCGAAYDGVSVNDVILSAKTTVYSLLDKYHDRQ